MNHGYGYRPPTMHHVLRTPTNDRLWFNQLKQLANSMQFPAHAPKTSRGTNNSRNQASAEASGAHARPNRAGEKTYKGKTMSKKALKRAKNQQRNAELAAENQTSEHPE